MSRAQALPLTAAAVKLGFVLGVLLSAGSVGYPALMGATDLPAVQGVGPSPATDNPWEKRTVAVYVAHEGPPSAHLDALAERELAHWEANSREYAEATVSFEPADERGSADLVVVFRENVSCGPGRFAVGCARARYSERTGRLTRATVWIRTGYDDPVVRHVLRHEFGHVFGLDHGDAAERPFMAPTIDPDGET